MTETPSSTTAPAAPATALTASQATLPTLGATIGSTVGVLLSSEFGGATSLIGHAVVAVTTTVFTALFHWIGTKFFGEK
jgi:hypothetical protein